MNDPKRIVIAGDWHQNTDHAVDLIRRLPDLLPHENPRRILHCGDFGFWRDRDGKRYLAKLGIALERVNGIIEFIDGNHEWHPGFADLMHVDGRGLAGPHIWHIPRGHRWTWHGREWIGIGGAVSVDRAARTEGRDWFPEESITNDQERDIVAAGPADVIVSHDCPSAVHHTFPQRPAWWRDEDLARSDAHRERLTRIGEALKPEQWFHGHLHIPDERVVKMAHGPVTVTSLNCDGEPGNWVVFDVETMRRMT